MNISLKVFILWGFLQPFNTLAFPHYKNPCPDQAANLLESAFVEISPDIYYAKCSFLKPYTEVIEEIHQWAPINRKFFLLFSEKKGTATGQMGRLLEMGEAVHQNEQDHQHELTVFSHELGHLILHQWLEEDFPKLKTAGKLFRNMTQIRFSLSALQGRARRDLENEYFRASSEYDRVWEDRDLDTLHRFMFSYTELFADIVAVLFRHDPKSIHACISHFCDQNENTRDFTQKHNPIAWSDDSQHGILSPVRSFFHSHFWQGHFENSEKQALVFALYEIIRDQLKYILELQKNLMALDPQRSYKQLPLSPQNLNLLFIEKLKNYKANKFYLDRNITRLLPGIKAGRAEIRKQTLDSLNQMGTRAIPHLLWSRWRGFSAAAAFGGIDTENISSFLEKNKGISENDRRFLTKILEIRSQRPRAPKGR